MKFDKITALDYRLAHDLHLLEARQQFAKIIAEVEKTGKRPKSACLGIMQSALVKARMYGLRARGMEAL